MSLTKTIVYLIGPAINGLIAGTGWMLLSEGVFHPLVIVYSVSVLSFSVGYIDGIKGSE